MGVVINVILQIARVFVRFPSSADPNSEHVSGACRKPENRVERSRRGRKRWSGSFFSGHVPGQNACVYSVFTVTDLFVIMKVKKYRKYVKSCTPHFSILDPTVHTLSFDSTFWWTLRLNYTEVT